MLESLFKCPAALQRLRSGALGPWVDSFVAHLAELGYTPWSRRSQVVLVVDLGRWMAQRQIVPEALDEAVVAACVAERRTQRDRRRCACLHFLDHLRAQGVIPPRRSQTDTSPLALHCSRFAEHLRKERGVCPGTVEVYVGVTRDFLRSVFDTEPIEIAALQGTDISQYLLHQAKTCAPRTVGNVAAALRSFLRYLFAHGQTCIDLSTAVLSPLAARISNVPRHLSAEDVEKLLTSCDVTTPTGRRDRAILLLLARLGLRAGEVARLELSDIHWRAAEIVVRGKGSFVDRLPLLSDVGDALALYLRDRPITTTRCVFMRRCPPVRALAGREAISSVVRSAVDRAGLEPPSRGAHLLRHSLGTRLIQAGASMSEIAQVLRHHASGSTEIYAKVDVEALRALAQPWPGVGGAQ